MREECKHFQSRTYASGEVARFCRLDLAPEAPWRCPEDCPKYEHRGYDAGWTLGSLRTANEPVAEPDSELPAYAAALTLLRYFDGYSFQKRLDVKNESDYVLLFAKGSDVRIAAWTTSSAHRITIPSDVPTFTIIKHTGEPSGSVSTNQGPISIEISSSPCV